MRALEKFDKILEGLGALGAAIIGGFLLWNGIPVWIDGNFFGAWLTVMGVICCVPAIRFLLSFLP